MSLSTSAASSAVESIVPWTAQRVKNRSSWLTAGGNWLASALQPV